jgi:hypothetical protein
MFTFNTPIIQTVTAVLLAWLALGLILWQAVLRSRTLTSSIPIPDNTDRRAVLVLHGAKIIKQLEGQLADYTHAVEVQLQSKIAVLDRLIADADREIIRLKEVLAETRRAEAPISRKLRQPDVLVPHEQRRAA